MRRIEGKCSQQPEINAKYYESPQTKYIFVYVVSKSISQMSAINNVYVSAHAV